MKARIIKDGGGCYVGEVYGVWENILLDTSHIGWCKVTGRCLTRYGAEYELRKWKRGHIPKEFEL